MKDNIKEIQPLRYFIVQLRQYIDCFRQRRSSLETNRKHTTLNHKSSLILNFTYADHWKHFLMKTYVLLSVYQGQDDYELVIICIPVEICGELIEKKRKKKKKFCLCILTSVFEVDRDIGVAPLSVRLDKRKLTVLDMTP